MKRKRNSIETPRNSENKKHATKTHDIAHNSKSLEMAAFIDLSFETETLNSDLEEEQTSEKSQSSMPVNIAKKRRNKFSWSTHSKWDNLDDALEFLESEGLVYYDDSDLIMGQKFYFRCKRTPKSVKPYCALRYTILLPAESNDIVLLTNDNEHNHNELMAGKKRMMSEEMIAYTNQLFEKGVSRYDQIIKFIEQERVNHNIFVNEPNPHPRQIEYRLKLFRNVDIKPVINIGDLMQ